MVTITPENGGLLAVMPVSTGIWTLKNRAEFSAGSGPSIVARHNQEKRFTLPPYFWVASGSMSLVAVALELPITENTAPQEAARIIDWVRQRNKPAGEPIQLLPDREYSIKDLQPVS